MKFECKSQVSWLPKMLKSKILYMILWSCIFSVQCFHILCGLRKKHFEKQVAFFTIASRFLTFSFFFFFLAQSSNCFRGSLLTTKSTPYHFHRRHPQPLRFQAKEEHWRQKDCLQPQKRQPSNSSDRPQEWWDWSTWETPATWTRSSKPCTLPNREYPCGVSFFTSS